MIKFFDLLLVIEKKLKILIFLTLILIFHTHDTKFIKFFSNNQRVIVVQKISAMNKRSYFKYFIFLIYCFRMSSLNYS